MENKFKFNESFFDDTDYEINKDIKGLEANITGEVQAKEQTMLKRLKSIVSSYEISKDRTLAMTSAMEKFYQDEITSLEGEIQKLKSKIDTLGVLSLNGTLETYNLYVALMDSYHYEDEILEAQRIRSIGNIVSSFASKENNKEFDEGKEY